MRKRSTEFLDLIALMRKSPSSDKLKHAQYEALCDVELGLHLQRRLMPGAPAREAWALFSGYPFAAARGIGGSPSSEAMLRAARYSLWPLRRPSAWNDALETYQKRDRRLRAFDIPDKEQAAVLRPLNVAPDRFDVYDQLLSQAPPLRGEPQAIAQPGANAFPVGRTVVTVHLPELSLPAPRGHDVNRLPAGRGEARRFSRQELLRTAASMDKVLNLNWTGRLSDIRFFVPGSDGYEPDQTFTVDGLQHLLGIVGAGKSTLRDVIAVHLAEQGLRTTVVVGDVAEQLKLVQLYNVYTDGAAAPVIGASGKEQHAQRLHRRLAGRGRNSLLAHHDPGFAYLSTSCALNALRTDEESDGGADELLAFNEAPCSRLRPARRQPPLTDATGEPMWAERKLACPFWTTCPRHQGARRLVDADIWVATPQSLIDAAVPWPQNGERLHYFELACRRSDLVIVDEADRVQTQLDQMFAPAIPLVNANGGLAFLDDVTTHMIRELAVGGRTQLSDRDVENWSASVGTASIATSRLMAMLVADRSLRDWVKGGYFSSWSLQLKLVDARYARQDDGTFAPDDVQPREELIKLLDAFRDEPFGDEFPGEDRDRWELDVLLGRILHTTRPDRTADHLADRIHQLFDLDPLLEAMRRESDEKRERQERERRKSAAKHRGARRSQRPVRDIPPFDAEKWRAEFVRRFEFTMYLCALEPKLALINTMWPRVTAALNLGFNKMYRRPSDYGPMVPEAPMSNVLGFQFLVDGPDDGGVRGGELRFFRCSGIGRQLLRVMPDLPTVDGRPRTNVLLMSGSSWAGVSSKYHVPVPVGVIIEPAPEAITPVVEETHMRFEFTYAGRTPRRLSGADLSQRAGILRDMVTELGDRGEEGTAAPLERELTGLPEERRHILLLVGSYGEAAVVADALHTMTYLGKRPWRGRVVRLVSDDAEISEPSPSEGDEHHAGVLRRGDVETLAETRAEILVAPLLAVERGHNILNEDKKAAIGSVYFLARPNPRPDDLGLAVNAVNHWIVQAMDNGQFDQWVRGEPTLHDGAQEVRRRARAEWYRVLNRSMAWSRLGDDREQVTWDILVLMWQVIGRLVRGGVPARVAFVDAAFAPQTADRAELPDSSQTSLLHSIHEVLAPYFGDDPAQPTEDRHIVRALYAPFWNALTRCLRQADEERKTSCTR